MNHRCYNRVKIIPQENIRDNFETFMNIPLHIFLGILTYYLTLLPSRLICHSQRSFQL